MNAREQLIEAIAEAVRTPINVKDHGAVGDQVTDDTAALQAALQAAIDGRFLQALSDLGAVVLMPVTRIADLEEGQPVWHRKDWSFTITETIYLPGLYVSALEGEQS